MNFQFQIGNKSININIEDTLELEPLDLDNYSENMEIKEPSEVDYKTMDLRDLCTKKYHCKSCDSLVINSPWLIERHLRTNKHKKSLKNRN